MFWKEIKGLYFCFKDTLSILMLGYRRRRKEKEKKKSKVECTLAGKDRIDTTQNYIRHILLYFWVEEWLWHCLHAPWWWPVFCLGGLPTPNKPDTPTFTFDDIAKQLTSLQLFWIFIDCCLKFSPHESVWKVGVARGQPGPWTPASCRFLPSSHSLQTTPVQNHRHMHMKICRWCISSLVDTRPPLSEALFWIPWSSGLVYGELGRQTKPALDPLF